MDAIAQHYPADDGPAAMADRSTMTFQPHWPDVASAALHIAAVAAVAVGVWGGFHTLDDSHAAQVAAWSRHPAHVTAVTGNRVTVTADEGNPPMVTTQTGLVGAQVGKPLVMWVSTDRTYATESKDESPIGYDISAVGTWFLAGVVVGIACMMLAIGINDE